MATVYINDVPVDIGNDRLNCVQAAERANAHIPHYCYHPALTVVASCRMCLIEMGELKDGVVTMIPKVFPGCQTPVKDGTVIVTGDYAKRAPSVKPLNYAAGYVPGDRAKKSQADTLEGLLLNHPLDCPVCDKAGECKLQDYSFQYGRSESRLVDEKNTPPNKPELSSKITLFTDRCIMCSRCVRFTREIAGTAELQIINRGHHAEIDVFPGEPLENNLAGNVVDLCPVGALGSKDFLYKQRVWYLKETPSVCTGCSTGCSIEVDSNKDVVFRLRPRENPQAQGYFMCDLGRYGYHYVNSKERIARPFIKKENQHTATTWNEIDKSLQSTFQTSANKNAAQTWFVISPFATVEEAYLLAKWAKGLSKQVKLALGPVPIEGEDDTYPKDRSGNPVQPVKFTIRAEKCPNRRGVEEILKFYQSEIITFNKVTEAQKRGEVKSLFILGGYPEAKWLPKINGETTAIIDLFSSETAKDSQFVLPATAFTEKAGIVVNHAGLAQTLVKAGNSPTEARSELQLFSNLLGRKGLVQIDSVRAELVKEVPAFAKLPIKFPELGFRLG